ncbi:hypothetical protein [Kitasatospora sp. LaBMicrA B282]|uniref:hypothetical protein n=1 Tax=Kitasatospora sp. LaBMicrA B282 TaxID=3420949 RepID=UPI003D0DA370
MPATEPIVLNFFGFEVAVSSADHDEVAFQFGPHAVRGSAATDQLRVEFTRPGPGGAEEILVRRGDGTPLLRRPFRGWGNVPPVLPPFAVLQDRFCLAQAVVLAKDGVTVALLGGPYSEQANVAAALAHRSWVFVSGRLLVMHRATRQVLPYLVPLEARGRSAAWLRGAGLPDGLWRTATSPVAGEVVLVRPECLGPVAPVRARLAPPTLVRLCRGADEGVRLTPWEFTAQTWPADGAQLLADAPTFRLELPGVSGAEEAAGLIDQAMSHKKGAPCLDVSTTAPAPRAGLTASLRI